MKNDTKIFVRKYTSKREKSVFLGVTMPQGYFEFLQMYSIIEECSKSESVRIAMRQFIDGRNIEGITMDTLINSFVNRAKRDYEFRKHQDDKTMSVNQFIIEITDQLIKRGFSETIINSIKAKLIPILK